jgi:hypothetical protein
MAQIVRRPGEEENHEEGEDGTAQPVDPNEIVIEGCDGKRLVVKLPEIPPPRATP